MKRGAAGLILIVTLFACARGAHVEFGDDTPSDLRELTTETLDDFFAAFPAQEQCFGTVMLEGARSLDDRAVYRPGQKTIVLRIPGTASKLKSALVHELAHHLEFSCASQEGFRDDFLRAQGLPDTLDWYDGPTWETTPSEQFAEAVAIVTLGYQEVNYRMTIRRPALDAVAGWGAGG